MNQEPYVTGIYIGLWWFCSSAGVTLCSYFSNTIFPRVGLIWSHKDFTLQSDPIMSPSVHLSWHHHTAQGVVAYSATLLNMTMLQTLTASMLWNMHAYTWGTPGKNRTMEMGVSYMNSYSAHTIYSTVLLWNKWEILLAVGTAMASDNSLLKIGPKGRKPEEFFLERR